eukprot:6360122-Amphidinium_carterae.1
MASCHTRHGVRLHRISKVPPVSCVHSQVPSPCTHCSLISSVSEPVNNEQQPKRDISYFSTRRI